MKTNIDTLKSWENLFVDYISSFDKTQNDASHDLGHFRRVYHTATCIAKKELGPIDHMVLLAAAYFHDIVSLPKDHVDSKMSSRYAAIKTKDILQELNFPREKIDPACHAIAAHSFSGGLQPETIEAKIIQDADRMEALGALGAMRAFYVSGRIGREPFDPHDLYAERRPLDDKMFGLDHFYVKLFKLPGLLQTEGGRMFADKRVEFLKFFVKELEEDIKQKNGGALTVVRTCHQAGSQDLKLFDLSNPLARNRELAPTSFVIDHLIEAREKFPVFITKFLSQFQVEIEVEEV